jgi:hypothetical protein
MEQRSRSVDLGLTEDALVFSHEPDGLGCWLPDTVTRRYGRLARGLRIRTYPHTVAAFGNRADLGWCAFTDGRRPADLALRGPVAVQALVGKASGHGGSGTATGSVDPAVRLPVAIDVPLLMIINLGIPGSFCRRSRSYEGLR